MTDDTTERERHLEMGQKRREVQQRLDEARTTEVEAALLAAAKSGDVDAMTFWLVNRALDRWKLDPQAPNERQRLAFGVNVFPESAARVE